MTNYREEVIRTSPTLNKESLETNLTIGALGLAGESGEVVDLIKKIVYHGKDLDKNKLIAELGDTYWYLEYLCISLGISSEEVKQRNVEKLRIRYPNGFNKVDSNLRRDEK